MKFLLKEFELKLDFVGHSDPYFRNIQSTGTYSTCDLYSWRHSPRIISKVYITLDLTFFNYTLYFYGWSNLVSWVRLPWIFLRCSSLLLENKSLYQRRVFGHQTWQCSLCLWRLVLMKRYWYSQFPNGCSLRVKGSDLDSYGGIMRH